MIKATLTRKYTPTQTLGELVIGNFKCKTLEFRRTSGILDVDCKLEVEDGGSARDVNSDTSFRSKS